MANGFNVAEQGHPINILPPVSISGGATAQAFSMKHAEHVSIIIAFGALASPPVNPTAILVKQCTDASGSNATALASFRYYYQSTAGAGYDTLDGYAQCLSNSPNLPPNYTASAAGITSFPSSVANLVYVIEIDSAELEVIADAVGSSTEYPYLQLVITSSATATYASAFAVLSGLRYASKLNATATT